MKALCIVLLVLVSSSCQNDTLVKGYVYNKEKLAIKDVKVLVNSSDIYTITDANGYFEIDSRGLSEELLFDKEGFELKFVNISNQKDSLMVFLKEKTR